MGYDPELERRKERAALEELLTLATGVAKGLGDWTAHAEPTHDRAVTLKGPNCEEIAMELSWRPCDAGRVFIKGRFSPQMASAAYKLDGSGTSCAVSRSPAAVAKEIKRRVLPTYLAELRRAAEAAHVEMAIRNRKLAVIADLESAMPKKGIHVREPDGLISAYRPGARKTIVKVNYNGSSVDLDLEVTSEEAKAILGLLGGAAPNAESGNAGAAVARLKVELHRAHTALAAARPVLAYVSAGRGYIGAGDPYPDATARRALALLEDALDPSTAAPVYADPAQPDTLTAKDSQ